MSRLAVLVALDAVMIVWSLAWLTVMAMDQRWGWIIFHAAFAFAWSKALWSDIRLWDES